MALNYHSFMSEKQPAKTHTNMLYLNKIHFHCAEKSSQNIQLNTEPFNFSVMMVNDLHRTFVFLWTTHLSMKLFVLYQRKR